MRKEDLPKPKENIMKPKQASQVNLIEGGRENWEETNEFKKKVEEINKELTDKYSLILLSEKNWAKRIFTIAKREIEIRKRIAKLSSLKNLHTTYHLQV